MNCIRCGRTVESKDVVISESHGANSIFCKNCAAAFGHCAMCTNCATCEFQENPDPMPQFVVVARQIRQGNATFVEQRQVPNPERIKKFCLDGKCVCCSDDLEHPVCCRHVYTTCTNYCEKY